MNDRDNIVVARGTLIFNGIPVGYTRDAVTTSREPNEKLVIDDVQQVMGVVDVKKIKQGFVVKANLYEFTLENLRLAWGLNSTVQQGAVDRTLSIDVSGDYPEGELLIMGKGPSNVDRDIRWYRAKLVDSGDVAQDAYGATVLPVTFQILVHEDYTTLGTITEDYVPSSGN